MQKYFLVLGILCLTHFSLSQKFAPVDAESKVSFVIKNFGLKVDGTFKGIKGSIQFDPNVLNNSSFNITVDANTIDTDLTARDRHLKKSDYFDIDQFPILQFVSTSISKSAKMGKYKIAGNLTIKGITKPIEFDFTANPNSSGFIFNGSFTVNRREFNVGGNSLSLSDNVNISLSIASNKITNTLK